MYENQTEQIIMNRMLNKITSPVYKGEGSFIWDALSPVSNEFAMRYMDLDSLLRIAFAQTSYGKYLDYIGGMLGVERKLAAKAIGSVAFSGTDGVFISQNTLVATVGGYQYRTDANCTITAGAATVTITAAEAGSAYDMPPRAICRLTVSINGVTGVTNAAVVDGGTEDEADDDYRARILLKAQTPATSGNVYHYQQWALETSGVGAAKVIPVWNGAGTVKVVIINENKKGASQIIVDACAEHIEGERPVGANVTVVSATELPVNIVVALSLDTGVEQSSAVAAIEAAVEEYLAEIAFEKNYVSYAKIGGIILDTAGVLDYSGLTINAGIENVTIGAEQVAVLGAVTDV